MRLVDFILVNTEAILREWDIFARSIWPDAKSTPLLLRDHAEAILRAAARDMATDQTGPQQHEKSKGGGIDGAGSAQLDQASKDHALGRVTSGFDLMALVAEYRALRASVIRLWTESSPNTDSQDLIDLTRFNESIDQSLGEAVRHFSEEMDRSRDMFLGVLGHDLRNPLNAMLLSAQSLSEDADPESAMLASRIVASGEAMSRMLADFLDFTASRLGRGLPVAPASVDLAKLCREVVEECTATGPGRTIDLKIHGDLTGLWDPGRMRQLLSNLIGNAIQHGSETLPVHVTAQATGTEVKLEVKMGACPSRRTSCPRYSNPSFRGCVPKHKARTGREAWGSGYISRGRS
jgi:signal transduction histidine kinase